jgi:hypothetical protein
MKEESMRNTLLTIAALFVVAGLAVAQSSYGSASQDPASGTSSMSSSQWADRGSINTNTDQASESQNNNIEAPDVTPSIKGTETEKAYQEASEPKNREGFSGFYNPDVTLSSPWNATN